MKKPLKILILEDEMIDVHLIERELNNGIFDFVTCVVSKRDAFEKALYEFLPDVILSDHSLTDINSFEALEIYKLFKLRKRKFIPFILVTGTVSEEFAIQCIKSGADDYILKDRLKRLIPSILSGLDKARIEGERARYLDELVAKQTMMKAAERLAKFGSWQIDLLTEEHKWSDEVFRIYGYEPGEVVPSNEFVLNHVHPLDRADLVSKLVHAANELDVYKHEFRIRSRTGHVRFLETDLVIERDEEGVPILLTGFVLDVTARKHSAEQLERSEQEFKSLFEQNPDAAYSLVLAGKFTNANQVLLKLLGLSREALFGKDFHPLLAPGGRSTFEANFRKVLKGMSSRFVISLRNPEKKEVLLDVTNMPVVVNDQIVGVHGIAKDITEKKALEDLLLKTNKLARIGGWELDLLLNKINWTEITRELHEVDPDFTPDLDKGLSFYKEGEHRERITRLVDRAITNGVPWDDEFLIVTASGAERWVRVIGEAEMVEGRCVRLYGSFQDIHVRKEAEERLKESYQERINILESIDDAFFAVDRNWTVIYWNKMAEKRLFMPRENVLGKNLWEVYSDAVPLSFFRFYHQAMNDNIAVHFTEFYPPLKIWVDVSAYPSANGLSIYFRDVTKMIMQTNEIKAKNERLLEIAWLQSHAVRAPLSRLLGLANLMKMEDRTSFTENSIGSRLLEAATELDSMIRQIVRKTEKINEDGLEEFNS